MYSIYNPWVLNLIKRIYKSNKADLEMKQVNYRTQQEQISEERLTYISQNVK